MKRYSTIRNYKKFKSINQKFVVFIKSGDYYYTYDADAKIMMFIFKSYNYELNSFMIQKENFNKVLNILLNQGLNVILAGWKNSSEYYSSFINQYDNILRHAKIEYQKTRANADEY